MFNLPTLLLLLVCVTFLTTLLLVVAALFSDRSPELRLWAAGNVAVSIGLVINGVDSEVVPGWLGIVIGNLLLAGGQATIVAGLRAFLGLKTPSWRIAAVSLFAALVCAYYLYIEPSVYARMLFASFFYGAINLIGAWTLRVKMDMPMLVAARTTGIGFLVMGCALFARGIYFIQHPVSGFDDQARMLFFWTILLAMLAQIAIAFGCILMVTYRYASEMKRLSRHDGLTGALNRSGITRHGIATLKRAMQTQSEVSLLLIDVDHFKQVNDQHGHPAGDQVLRHLVDVVQAQIRPHDRLGRFGGEEFLVILDSAGPREAEVTAERLRLAIEHSPAQVDGKSLIFTVSIGSVSSRDAGYGFDRLVAEADKALYEAKQAGRNRVCRVKPAPVPSGRRRHPD